MTDDMSVRSWQNTLVRTYVAAVQSGDKHDIAMAGHNLAVHIAHTRETFDVLKVVLVDGGAHLFAAKQETHPLEDAIRATQEETDTASMFWEQMKNRGILTRVSQTDEEYATIPWPVKDCD